MSKTYTYQTTVEVDVLDAEGYATDRTALVYFELAKEVDANADSDADGKRGRLRISYEILRTWIDADDLKTLTAAEAIQCINDAEAEFKRVNKDFT